MSDLMSRDVVIARINEETLFQLHNFKDGEARGLIYAKEIVQNAPTVDAVEVVRCKDCYFFTPVVFDNPLAMKDVGKCAFLIGERQYTSCNGFCHLGERKEVSE